MDVPTSRVGKRRIDLIHSWAQATLPNLVVGKSDNICHLNDILIQYLLIPRECYFSPLCYSYERCFSKIRICLFYTLVYYNRS